MNSSFKHNAVHFQILSELAELQKYAQQWNALAASASNQSPLMGYEWLYTYFERCNDPWLVCIACCDNELICVLPLIKTQEKRYGISYQALSLPYSTETMSVDMLLKGVGQDSLFQAMVKHVMAYFPRVQCLHFKRIDNVSKTLSYDRPWLSIKAFIENGASLSNNMLYAERKSHLPKNFKSNLNKANNKAKKLGNIEFVISDEQLPVEDQLALLIDVEFDSWKGVEGTAIACSDDNIQFYKALVKRLDKQGQLAIHYLKVNDEVVATNLGIHFHSSLLLWKLGYRDEFKKISPGGLLMERLLQHVETDPEIMRIDLMTNESWYNNWNMEWRPFYDLYIYKPSLLGLYLFMMQSLKMLVKKLMKS